MGRISELIGKYCKNIDKQKELNDSLLEELEKDEWTQKMRDRSMLLRKLSEDNARLTADLEEILKADLSKEEYEELYDRAGWMYYNDYDEYVVLCPILECLLGFYENTDDYSKRIFIYRALHYERTEVRSRGSGKTRIDYEMLRRILALREHYLELEDNDRCNIWVSYYNYVVVDMENDDFDVNASYLRLKEANDFWIPLRSSSAFI